MTFADPTHQIFWFASRAFGIVAIVALGVSVAMGLAMSGAVAYFRQAGTPSRPPGQVQALA